MVIRKAGNAGFQPAMSGQDGRSPKGWHSRGYLPHVDSLHLLHFDGQRYRMIAWCIMPNHVHVLIESIDAAHLLPSIIHSWKSFTATKVNKLLGRSGSFWMEDYYDRFIRNDAHLQATLDYIRQNPVKAGLVPQAEEWTYAGPRASSPQCAGARPSWPHCGLEARGPTTKETT